MSLAEHTCAATGRSNCDQCLRFEKALWDAVNDYALSVGGDPSGHVYGNTARMQAVAAVGRIVDQTGSSTRCLTDENKELRAKILELERDHTHLQRLYTESRDYVRVLVDERDALVEASRRDVAEIDRLDAEVTALRKGS